MTASTTFWGIQQCLRSLLLAICVLPIAHSYVHVGLVAKYSDGISYTPLPGANSEVKRNSPVCVPRFSPGIAVPNPPELKGSSRLFLDTADTKEWDKHLPLGIYHGVTTNPVLLERAGVKCTAESMEALSAFAFSLGVKEFMCQAWGETADGMIETGTNLARMDSRIVVKVPLTAAGITAGSVLAKQGCRICMTACYTPHQVLTSIALGAEYVAPYLGRMIDSGKDGIDSCTQMQRIIASASSHTRLLVASIRDADQMAVLAANGCDTFTLNPSISEQLSGDPMSISAAADFEKAAKKMQGGDEKKRSIGFMI